MVGASLSGVTFISVPGMVGSADFTYLQMVMGFMAGYVFIMAVLLPLYYRLGLTSIYTYLQGRFGNYSYKTGASFFMLSRIIGASFRLFLVAIVVELAILEPMFSQSVPSWAFAVIVAVVLAVIYLYTRKGGMATVIWTDTVQTAAMLTAVILTVLAIANTQGAHWTEIPELVKSSGMTKIFVFDDWKAGNHFVKHFLAGAFVCIAMTGLDQDMMQKNLSCRNIKEAQLNMASFSIVLVFVNLLFLSLGALLYIFAAEKGIAIPEKSDLLYATIALEHLSPFIGITFILGLIAAAYSSADSALTALTTSVCVDILNFRETNDQNVMQQQQKTRFAVHIGVSVMLFFTIILFWFINDDTVISQIFKVAGYTYGPLLGLYVFGFFTKMKPNDALVPFVCVAAPIATYVLNYFSETLFWGYKFGFELLLLNGLLTFLGLLLISQKK